MKPSTLIKSSVVVASLLVITACSGKNREGGEPAPAPAPVAVQPTVLPGSEFYDNSQGLNPLNSIKKDALRSAILGLADASGTTSPHYSRIVLSFDSQGLLSATGSIDISAFNLSGAQQQPGLDWSQQNQGVSQEVVAFNARNIPYYFNRVTGVINIDNFAMSSAKESAVSPQMVQLGGTQNSTARMGVLVAGAVYKRKDGRFFTSQSLRQRRSIEGRLWNLAEGEMLDPSSMAGFNPQTSGFNIYENVSVTAGQITTISQPMTSFNQDGTVATTQSTREVYMPTYAPGAYVFIEPVLDPRVQ